MALISSLISSWSYEETGNDDRTDDHGVNDLTVVNGDDISSVDGIIGKAVQFDANDGVLRRLNANAATLQLGTASRTIELWAKFPSLPSQFRGIIMFGASSTTEEGYCIVVNNQTVTKGIRFNISNGSSRTILDSNANVIDADGNWYQIVIVIDRSANTATIYVNGVVASSTGTVFGTEDIQSAQDFEQNGFFSSGGFNGVLDNGRVFSKALSAAEITELYNERKSVSYHTLNNEEYTLETNTIAQYTLTTS